MCGVGFLLSKKSLYVWKRGDGVWKDIFQNANCSFVHVMGFWVIFFPSSLQISVDMYILHL